MQTRKIPNFASEAEEAEWWYDHRDETAADLLAAVREGRNGMGSLGRAKKLHEAAEANAQGSQTASVR